MQIQDIHNNPGIWHHENCKGNEKAHHGLTPESSVLTQATAAPWHLHGVKAPMATCAWI